MSNLYPLLLIFPSSFDARYNKFEVLNFKSTFPIISENFLHLPKPDILISSSWHYSFVKVNALNSKIIMRL